VKYNIIYSLLHYLVFKITRRIKFLEDNVGNQVILRKVENYKVFLEMEVLTKDKQPKQGNAIFRVYFHASSVSQATIIKRTKYTIPFFVGLPGFCTKQFLVNQDDGIFSGRYEWETIEMAQRYASSYAVKFMKKRSSPYPISYEIIDKKTNETVECAQF